MRKLQLLVASAAVALTFSSPAAADDGPPGLRGFFSGTSSDGTPFSGMIFYQGPGAPTSFISFTVDGEHFTLPIEGAEASAPLFLPPTSTNGSATFYAFNGSFSSTDFANFSVSNISAEIGSNYIGWTPEVADILNAGTASAGFSFGNVGGGGPVSFHFDFAPALPEPSTWAMMLLGFGAIGITLRRRRSLRQGVSTAA